ncbi:DEAD/DEAH box helicase [Gimibacter soli]|uniref:DEAD-box ATP-dependent RNA helicase RhpA n=1 Tax=Gimibacter soli TaxID=3024400 RepID=A0AAE9XKQ5_9PROT|nr:DEAD/DEAH box helicase [Gimibacter soli]WCL52969.1 DEAD/DEAH box helicase [Gimibacter soli]
MGFDLLGLSEPTLKAVTDSGYSEPTPIQAQAIPQVLMGRDVLGIAQTGTGKTASFTLPMIDILAHGRARARMPRSLILEPTRELAAQVAENFEKYGKNHKLNMALLIGGVNFADQEKALDRGVDVLIATPGRLLDHFERGKLLLTGIEILVVDEADRMLDMGFIPDVEKICERIPRQHQTLFFSATMPPVIQRLTQQFLNDPKKIEVSRPSSTSATITQNLIEVDHVKQKRRVLRALLRTEDVKNGIIFCNRKTSVKETFESLKRHGFSVGQLHGDMAQSERLEILRQFKENEIKLLCASDVAARGLDIADVSHVFNLDVPSHAEDYVHRIGRTGRAGRLGNAFTIAAKTRDDDKYVAAIEKMTGNKLPRTDVPDDNADDEPLPGKSRPRREKPEAAAPASEEKPRASRSRRPRKEEAPAEKQPAPKAEPQAEAKAATPRPQPEKRAEKPAPRGRRRRDDDDDFEPVVGMGDHMPAFLMAPVKLSK